MTHYEAGDRSPMKIKIKHLHPTQMSVGYEQVNEKSKHMNKKKHKELDDYLYEHVVPIVLGPENKMYIIDHHHLCFAAHQSDIDEVYGKIIKDFSSMNDIDFWDIMKTNNYIWLYDTDGNNINLSQFLLLLPDSIKKLRDDPYRSLAGIVRKEGGFTKDITPFSEFHWANFYRNKIPNVNFSNKTVEYAIYLSTTDEAKDLPGFTSLKL